mmetsp:Transcript_126926/g.406434  ORF Transcript_126926/g.406434 Transcript_126926/m.406434 type:complete len:207 (+) Transcript_126926:386-1006(+)
MRHHLARPSCTISRDCCPVLKTMPAKALFRRLDGRSPKSPSESTRCSISEGNLGSRRTKPCSVMQASPTNSPSSPMRKQRSSRLIPRSRSVATSATNTAPALSRRSAASVSEYVGAEFSSAQRSKSRGRISARSPEPSSRKIRGAATLWHSRTSSLGIHWLRSTSSYSESLPGSSRPCVPAGLPAFTRRRSQDVTHSSYKRMTCVS